jgi:osmotically-inducible protein OsmY
LFSLEEDHIPIIENARTVKKLVKLSDHALAPVKAAASIKTAWMLNSQLYIYDLQAIAIDKKILLKGLLSNDTDKNLALFIARSFSLEIPLIDQLVVSEKALQDPAGFSQQQTIDGTNEPVYQVIRDLSAESQAEKLLLANEELSDMRINCSRGTAYIEGNVKSKRVLDRFKNSLVSIDGIDKVEHQGSITQLSFAEKMKRSWNKRKEYFSEKAPEWKEKISDTGSNLGDKISAGAKSTGKVISDSWITSKIMSKFAVNSKVSPFRIKARTRQGNVTLYGTANSMAELEEAEYIAKNTSGVVQIFNQIQVK